uniref:Isoform 2 of Calcium-gated potassium channel TvoK n=1 Tax=Thermoplasma volcanium (strain ATCC 51530 / DSM 4299 / JCM 9571 / NBRC 15438 / GSS1) TaxID=273116 RepID=Q979Z2-2
MEKRLKNHTIICNWNAYTRNIIEGNRDEEAAPIVILSENTDNSEKYQNVFFVKGDCTSEDDLKNAAIEDAARVVIMSDIENNAIPEDLLDAKTLLSIFTVRKLNNAVEIIAEVRDEKNKKHAVSAGATEVLSVGELSSRLISRSISNPGLTDFILKSLSETEDFKIFSIEACGILPGMTVKDAASNLAEVCVIISVISKGKIEYPPDRSYKIGAGDYVVFLAKNKKEVEEAIKG